MSYLNENFLLRTATAQKLYFDYAKDMPIFDFHCHLNEKELLENKPFEDIWEMWLKYDHYKWRLMRISGIEERYITGDATSKEKFVAYCTAIEGALGNPLYNWSQLELQEYFDCDLEINSKNADKIWEIANEYLKKNEVKPSDIIKKSNVKYIFTTNEVFDDLDTFSKLKSKHLGFDVYPTFRADKLMNISADNYLELLSKIQMNNEKISNISILEKVIEYKLNCFISVGCVVCDIAPETVYEIPTKEQANKVFKKALSGKKVTKHESEVFKGYMTYFLMQLCARYNVAAQLHIGATRNNNTKMFKKLGADSGYDAMGEDACIDKVQKLLDRLNSENLLTKTIMFNLNPKMNVPLMTLAGCFHIEKVKGGVQVGAAWWFNDHKVGIENLLKDFSASGHLGSSVGMLTDSRSFLSYTRHHYFRRVLCNYLADLMENGEITNDIEIVGEIVKNISYNNVLNYFYSK